jgi:hypothetical protein
VEATERTAVRHTVRSILGAGEGDGDSFGFILWLQLFELLMKLQDFLVASKNSRLVALPPSLSSWPSLPTFEVVVVVVGGGELILMGWRRMERWWPPCHRWNLNHYTTITPPPPLPSVTTTISHSEDDVRPQPQQGIVLPSFLDNLP